MPTYVLKHKKTGEVEERLCSISEMQELTDEETGEFTQIIKSPRIVTHVGSILGKTNGDWKNLLEKIDRGAGRHSKINH